VTGVLDVTPGGVVANRPGRAGIYLGGAAGLTTTAAMSMTDDDPAGRFGAGATH
jgi:hypothetical protein